MACPPFGAGLRQKDGLAVTLCHFEQHVGERAIFVVPHRDGRSVELPLIVRIEIEPDQIHNEGSPPSSGSARPVIQS